MDIIEKYKVLIREDIVCSNLKVNHLEKIINNYSVNIICCEFNNEKDLEKHWKGIVDNVAIHIQAKLNKTIELYNVYVVFFNEEISSELRCKIEQDRYSSRKIVFEVKMPDSIEKIEKLLEDKLFSFFVEESEKCLKLDEKLKAINNELYKHIDSIETIDDTILDEIISIL